VDYLNISRAEQIDEFLQQNGWLNPVLEKIPGDASFRRYIRVKDEQGRKAVIMDAPPEKEPVALFLRVQRYYQRNGLRVPECFAAEESKGLLLLEDIGDLSVSQYLVKYSEKEEYIYRQAIDILVNAFHAGLSIITSQDSFENYSHEKMLQEVMLLPEWLLPEILPSNHVIEAGQEYEAIWQQLIRQNQKQPEVVVHRDYHADNLFVLQDETLVMLDFQDAVLGQPAYDVVSLLEDARRDVNPHVVQAMLEHFILQTKIDREEFMASHAFYGAQRNAKILGIFTRLYRRDAKPRYLGMLPRVWRYFEHSCEHPALHDLRAWRARWITSDVEHKLLTLQESVMREAC
jgi:aminoglycoside/choline kinase family phosphotransferase